MSILGIGKLYLSLFHTEHLSIYHIDNFLFIMYTVWLNWRAHFAVDILLLHHYGSDLAHLSDFGSLVIRISKYER